MLFSYANFVATPDGAFPTRNGLRRPVIALVLRNGERYFTTMAIVDSGSDFCIFPSSVARKLGISIPNERATLFSGTSEAPQMAFFAVVRATIWNANENEVPIDFELYAGFCDTLEHIGLGLLGQEGFFSRFVVGFDYANNSPTVD
jgi:hypothetical protein